MKRRGIAGPALIELTLVALIIVVLVVIIVMSRTSFIDTIYCTGGTESGGELMCKSKVEGCGDAGNHYLGFLGCGEGQTCCKTGVKAGAPVVSSGSSNTNNQPEIAQIAPTDFKVTDATTKRGVAENSITTLYAGNDRTFTLDVELPKCAGCNWTYEEVHSTRSGAVVYSQPAVNITVSKEVPDVEKEIERRFSNIELKTDSKYAGETITVRILLTPWRFDGTGSNRKVVEGTTQHFTFRYKVDSPVKIQGLSPQWAQKKTVLVTCGPDAQCSDIFYTLLDAEELKQYDEECPMPAGDVQPVTLETKYCQVINGQLTNCNFNTDSACNAENDRKSNPEMNSATIAIQTALENGLPLPQIVPQLNQLSTIEPEASGYTCQIDTDSAKAAQYKSSYIKPNATFNDQAQQGIIELDRAFMSGQFLCVYGRDKFDKNKYYVAGKPQELKIDRVPPVAELRFYPSTLRLTFACQDDLSGCKDVYWTAYVSELSKFFPALMNAGGQNAAAWCPSYKSTAGYRVQTSREVIYRSNEVRVLCLRVEDNAGNAGVSKVTVYNSYQLAAEVLKEAMD